MLVSSIFLIAGHLSIRAPLSSHELGLKATQTVVLYRTGKQKNNVSNTVLFFEKAWHPTIVKCRLN